MSETRERELVERVARAIYAKNPELYFYERPGGPPGNQFLDWEHCSDFAKGRARDQARAAIERLSASTQVDAMREALEEARAAIIEAAKDTLWCSDKYPETRSGSMRSTGSLVAKPCAQNGPGGVK